MEYCYEIKKFDENEESITESIELEDNDIDEEELKQFIESLYTNKKKLKELAFDKDTEDLPYITIFTKRDGKICIKLTSKSKKVIEKIQQIHDKIKDKDLFFKKNIKLSRPYLEELKIQEWWADKKKPDIKGKRWDSIVQQGPYFTHIYEPYEPLGATIKYDGKKYSLSPVEEKVLRYYANRLITEKKGDIAEYWTKDELFNTNYFNDLKTYLTSEHKKIFVNFKKIDFSNLIELIERYKENKKNIDKNEKKKLKEKTEKKKKEYGFALIDGIREKVANFVIEPGAIFYGRGDNPHRGKIKREIEPEDVTLNIGEYDPIPKPPPGHTWGKIVHEHDSVWLASWIEPIHNNRKYILFSAEGKFKGEGDLVKYEKARKLEKNIDNIRSQYMRDANSDQLMKRQLGTVLYLIDNFGFRIGNEKSAEEVDTVGASTLRVEHVKFKPPNILIFDFKGKDSIPFYKELKVDNLIYNNFQKFIKNKKNTDDIFDQIKAIDINNYLKTFDKSFSAKVFRTRLASVLMYNELLNLHIPEESSKSKIKTIFNNANSNVANVLNHRKTVSKKAQESIQNIEKKLKEKEKELKLKKKEGKSTVAIEKQIDNLKNNIESKSNTLNVAINTSLNNYIDPRLIISWCKRENVEFDYIYSATLLKKFNWATVTTDSEWDYLNTELIGNPKLEPYVETKEYKGKTTSKSQYSKKQTSKKETKLEETESDTEKVERKLKQQEEKEKEEKERKKRERREKKEDKNIVYPKLDKIYKFGDNIIENYNENSFSVSGNTYDVKNNLVNLKGKWNQYMKKWFFSYKHKDDVLKFFEKYNDKSYDILLSLCKMNGMNIQDINTNLISNDSLLWIYPFVNYVNNKKNKNLAITIIINLYNKRFNK